MRPDVPKMLNDLTKSGYKLGVISNTDSTNFVIYRLIDNNIYKYFPNNLIFMSCVCKKRKPAKDIFIVACEEAGVKPNEMVYVGDTISRDVAGSRNAGIKACVRINSSLTEKSDKGIKAGDDTPYVVKSLSELPAILKKINAAKK
jgi:putative hydrolase of the HAD superfamily